MKLNVRMFKIGQSLSREALEQELYGLSYQKTDFVTKAGEFALRGGVCDIYPVTYRAPVRLEFRHETLASIHDFSPVDGKTLTSFQEIYLIPVSKTFQKKIQWAKKNLESFDPLTEKKDILPGDFVVHLKYGIGRYLGNKTLKIDGQSKRHLAIEYADQEVLYLDYQEPLERYIGSEGRTPRLTKLHGKEWQRIKDQTRRAVSSVAADLLEIQARRTFGRGIAFPKDHEWQERFEALFDFEETPDQKRAAEEVKKDMERGKPMDRLLAGDVGYGKTEVAMRAAFKAVTGGHQVAVLVPTTVLAEQHFLVLKRRLQSFPVTVEVLSRFRSRKDQAVILKGLKEGAVDILIGTHRLLSDDIVFKKLGLLIIDEEQRFGVRHKEKLKQFRSTVDVLSLTATPIPRTLYMAMVGVRDMSLIQTPPKNRMPIETYILEFDDRIVREAIKREIDRGGQVYFIHNRVQSIDKVCRHLKDLLPQVRFAVAHGQMAPQVLESIMQDFIDGKIDCLIATNIIESGIDIPNANTILINRADLFGLADLYQLRGRVGRFHEVRQAYAYLMTPKNWVMTQDAEKRLAAIERFTELGSGFKIAMEDLEIRGAGNILGHEQSGFIHAVGFDLYCRMLQEEISKKKSKS